jgi:[acyl-carrier-protein] S-malonyltransferase
MTAAYLFPGQGAQSVGMGKDFCERSSAARSVFEQAEKVTGLPLMKLCFDGPEDELARTVVSQPAIFAASAAVLAAMEERLGPGAIRPTCLAGLSLGEYTALYAAGAMDLATGLKLVARRGQLMQAAAEARPSGMVSVIGLDETKAWELCAAARGGEVLICANFNCPGQIVLSGEIGACQRAAGLAGQFGASGAVPLKVAGAFHSELMRPAAERFAEALDGVTFADPAIEVVANVDAMPYKDASGIKEKLVAQLVSPVRWQQSVEAMLASGADSFYEIGPGRVLAGLVRRISRRTSVTSLNGWDALEKLAHESRQDA